jgi:uncharacterized protein YdhG (YjbR/CyaY superfamily)
MSTNDVDAYIATAPTVFQEKLHTLRAAILEAVPEANERLSYRMPYYDYYGRLAYFRLAKKHIGLYIPSPVIDQHRNNLAGIHAVQATIHLPLGEEIPVPLVQKLVKARARLNEEANKAKQLGRQPR